jgi:ABC-type sugar transport system ATPase subunit
VGELMRSVCDQGVPILLISHNLPQIHALCDRVVVLFQGRVVTDLRPAECTVEEIVSWITGASLAATAATVSQLSRSGGHHGA